MKKSIFLCSILFATPAFSQVSYIEEAKQLGSVAGQGKVCNAKRADTFEMLARAIILSKAPDAASRDSALRAYIKEKANGYILAKSDCQEVLNVFDTQQIFNIKIYQDGTLQMPDGTIITPKIPYDASQI